MGLGIELAVPKLLTATPSLTLRPSTVLLQHGVPAFGWGSPGAFPEQYLEPTSHAKKIFLIEPEAASVCGLTPNCEVI